MKSRASFVPPPNASPRALPSLVTGPVCVCVANSMTFAAGMPVSASTFARVAFVMPNVVPMRSRPTSAARVPSFSSTRTRANSLSSVPSAPRVA